MSDDSAPSGGYAREPSHTLYAVALQQALKSGDLAQMRALAARARSEGSDDPAIQAALKDLEAEIDRAGNS